MIGIFDSGVGGLTVARALLERYPSQPLTYLGDTARVPYGNKTGHTVVQYALESAEFLQQFPLSALVIACNTASAHAADVLRTRLDIPIFDVIKPGAQAAADASCTGKIGVIATRSTITSGAYQQAIDLLDPSLSVFSVSCPLLVPLAEEGLTHHPATELLLTEYLTPLLDHGIDTLLLGCTHYPLLLDAIKKIVGDQVVVVDSAHACAERVGEALGEGIPHPEHMFYVTDGVEMFKQSVERFLGLTPDCDLISLASLAHHQRSGNSTYGTK